MEICNTTPCKPKESTNFIKGNLYKWWNTNDMYIATDERYLVNLETGTHFLSLEQHNYVNVTTQYCLMKKELA